MGGRVDQNGVLIQKEAVLKNDNLQNFLKKINFIKSVSLFIRQITYMNYIN